MIRSHNIKSFFKFNPFLTFNNTHSYVKQKQIDQISKGYGQTKWQKIKMYGAIFKHIGFEGFKAFRADLKLFSQLKSKQQLTPEQTKSMQRIYNDIFKMGPLIIIQILPFSGPLFMLYMYTYPGSIPSWFMIDYYHDRHELLKIKNQQKNIKFFKQKGLKPEDINLDTMTLRQLRKLTLLMFGIYRDGTIGYRRLFNKKIQYFISESYSRFLLKRNLVKIFKRNLNLRELTSQMNTLEQKVKWRYQKIMQGQFIKQFKPMYENTLERIKVDQGEQAKIFRQIQNQDGTKQKQSPKNSNNPPQQGQPKDK